MHVLLLLFKIIHYVKETTENNVNSSSIDKLVVRASSYVLPADAADEGRD